MDGVRLCLAAFLAGCAAWLLSNAVSWPPSSFGLLLQVGLSAAAGLLVYTGMGSVLGVDEIGQIAGSLTRRFSRR